jgi:hypothetical protein
MINQHGRFQFEDNIKMNFKEMDGVDWINLARHRNQQADSYEHKSCCYVGQYTVTSNWSFLNKYEY